MVYAVRYEGNISINSIPITPGAEDLSADVSEAQSRKAESKN